MQIYENSNNFLNLPGYSLILSLAIKKLSSLPSGTLPAGGEKSYKLLETNLVTVSHFFCNGPLDWCICMYHYDLLQILNGMTMLER